MKNKPSFFVITLVFMLALTPVACVAPMASPGAPAAMSNESPQANVASPSNNEPQVATELPTEEPQLLIESELPTLCDPFNPVLTPLNGSELPIDETRALSSTSDTSYFVSERGYTNSNGQHFKLTIQGDDDGEDVRQYIDEAQICFEAIRIESLSSGEELFFEDRVIGVDDTVTAEQQAEREQVFEDSQSMTEAVLFGFNPSGNNLLIEMEWLDQPHLATGWRSYYGNNLLEDDRERFEDSLPRLEERFAYLEMLGLADSSDFIDWFTKNLELLDSKEFWALDLYEECKVSEQDTSVVLPEFVSYEYKHLLFGIVWCSLIQVPDIAMQHGQLPFEEFIEWLFIWKGNHLISDWWLSQIVTPVDFHAIHFVIDPSLEGQEYHAYQSTGFTTSGRALLNVASESASIYVRRCFDLQDFPSKSYTPSSEPTPLAFSSSQKTRFDAGVDGSPNYSSSSYTISGTWVTGVSAYGVKLQKSNDILCP